ncbi:tannase/feruloyl esterase family alpha/beta hydrolase [Pseudomonas aeruginosa]|nr:tannase/feruloyl esterase family alpha/beta hydrolase [Pseudomonas aeruginosa]HBP5759788.1 tannase/feruloyl esterase family alpha/beta hydrolase [Pseudomonas aeruginosa]
MGTAEDRLRARSAICHAPAGKTRDHGLDRFLQPLAATFGAGLPQPNAVRTTLVGGAAQICRLRTGLRTPVFRGNLRDTAFALIKKRYNEAPVKSYCYGHSNGGRDCMAAIQHYPLDYDGVVANEAVVNYTADMLHNMRITKNMIDGGWLSAAKVKLLSDNTRSACDALDGVVDGVIGKYHSCNFDAHTLRCPSGGDEGDSCLSGAQVATIDTIQNPVSRLPLANGSVYPGFQWKGGEDAPDGYARVWTGATPPLKVEASGTAFQPNVGFILVYGRSFVRYWFGGSDDYQTYNFDESQYQDRIAQISSIIDATNPDLTAFFAHGGKLLMKDNSNDYAQSPQQRIQYIADLTKAVGQKAVEDNFRWFVAAGAGHFGVDGPGLSDHIQMIEDWVEKGQVPADTQIAVQNDAKTLKVTKSRPMCRYPLYPKYKGSGDVNVADSFTCAAS